MLGVTDFLIKDRLDAGPARALDPLRGPPPRGAQRAARDPGPLRARGEGRERRDLGLGPGRRHGLLRPALEGRCSATPRRRSATRPTSGSIACAPRTSRTCGPRSTPTSRAHSPHFESEHRIRHADGSYRWVFSRGVAVRDRDGTATRVAGSMTDITHRKAAEERLRHDARHDSLTGLPEPDDVPRPPGALAEPREARSALSLRRPLPRPEPVQARQRRLQPRGRRPAARRARPAAAGVDARRRHGRPARRRRVHRPAARHRHRSRPRWRWPSGSRQPSAEPFSTEGRDLIVTASIGIAASEPGSEAAELMRNADIAMYEAKLGSDDDTAVFTASMRRRVVGQLQLEAELRETIEKRAAAGLLPADRRDRERQARRARGARAVAGRRRAGRCRRSSSSRWPRTPA